jgi:hypothetical protein
MNFDLDAFLLQQTQKMSHVVQSFTGVTCFRLSLCILILWLIELSLLILFGVHPILFVLGVWAGMRLYNDIRENERNCPPYMNFIEVTWTGNRTRQLFALMLSGVFQIWVLWIIIVPWAITIYLASCTPLPPQDGKIKTWFRSGKSWLASKVKPEEPEPEALPQPA